MFAVHSMLSQHANPHGGSEIVRLASSYYSSSTRFDTIKAAAFNCILINWSQLNDYVTRPFHTAHARRSHACLNGPPKQARLSGAAIFFIRASQDSIIRENPPNNP